MCKFMRRKPTLNEISSLPQGLAALSGVRPRTTSRSSTPRRLQGLEGVLDIASDAPMRRERAPRAAIAPAGSAKRESTPTDLSREDIAAWPRSQSNAHGRRYCE